MRDFLARRKKCGRFKCNCEVVLVCVAAIMNILEWNWGLGKNIEVGWVGFPQTLSSVDTVYYEVGSADGRISQTMQYLKTRGVFVESWKRSNLQM